MLLFGKTLHLRYATRRAESGNRLAAADPGSYTHIEVRRDLKLPDLELVRQVTNSIIPGSAACDILDAVIVAMDVFVTRTADMKKKPEKMELLVFSDLVVGYTDPDAQIHDVVGGLVNEGIVVKSIGHSSDDFGRDEDEIEDEGGGGGAVKTEEETTVSVVGGDPVSAVRLVCQQTGGMMYTMAEAMPVLSQYKIRGVKPSTVFHMDEEERDTAGIRSGGGRDSSSAYLHHRSVPALLARAEALLGRPRTYFEFPQV